MKDQILFSDAEINDLVNLMGELHYLHNKTNFDSTWKKKWLINKLSCNKDFFVYPDKIKNVIIGYIMFEVRYDEYSTAHYGYIRELYVCKDYRNYQRAKYLMNLAEEYFKEKKCTRIEFLSPLDNRYRPFFERLSYKKTHIVMGKKL